MKKRIITLLLAMGMAMGSGLTAYATPARMEDGTLFGAADPRRDGKALGY